MKLLDNFVENELPINKIINFCENNDIEGLKKYVEKKYTYDFTYNTEFKKCDPLIIAISNNYSIEYIEIIIKLYKDLNYSYSYNEKSHLPSNYPFKKVMVSPLLVAVAKNKFDIANLMLQRNAKIDYEIFQILLNEQLLNRENLKYLLNNGLIIDDNLLKETLYQWLSDFKNDLLEIIFKYYIIYHYDELKNKSIWTVPYIERIIQKAIIFRNYKALQYFIRDSGEKEEDFLKKVLNVFENYKNSKIEFLNSIDDEKVKIKIEKFLSKRKDIIEILKRNNLSEFQQFIDENYIIIKNLNNKNFDILISAIECGVSNDIINYIINQVNYDSLDYCFRYENNEYQYSFYESIPLFVAIVKNEFDIANLLLKNNANINYNDLYKFLNDNNVLNSDNLKFILNNGIKICNSSLEKVMNKWITNNKNNLLKIIFKYYIISHYNELKNIRENKNSRNDNKTSFIEKIIQKAVAVENFEVLKYFINESGEYEEEIIEILFNIIENENKPLYRKNYIGFEYNDFEKYTSNNNNKICNNDNKKMKVLNFINSKELEIKNENVLSRGKELEIKTENVLSRGKKLKNKTEEVLSRRKDITEILKRNDLSEFQQFIDENNIMLKDINNKNFDILILAIECGVSSDIINYIINQVNYDSLDYCFRYKNNEYQYSFHESIPLYVAIAKNEFDVANLLLQNNANINYSYYYNENLFEFLNNNNVMNSANLKFILNKGIKIDDSLLEKVMNECITNNKNDLLEILFDYYIINHYDELKYEYNYYSYYFIKSLIKESVDNENYKFVEIIIRNSGEMEERILNITYSIFKKCDNDQRNNRYNYFMDNKLKVEKTNSEDKMNIFLKSIDNEEVKIKIEKYLSKRKDIIEILKRNNLLELQQFIDKNDIVLEKINNEDFDMLISAIEYGVSNDIIHYIINQVNYDSLDYSFSYENNEYHYSFHESIPLFVAIAKNEFDIANLLLQNKANINYNYYCNLFKFLNDENVMNSDNLKFILNNGIKIDDSSLEETISKWLSDNKNDLLEIIFKYYLIKVLNYKEKFSLIEKAIQSALTVENYKIIEFFINESDEKEVIFNILSNIFEGNSDTMSMRQKNYRFFNDFSIRYMEIYKDKITKFLNFIDNKDLKIKIEKFLSKRKDIIEILKRNNLSELQQFIDENNIMLKNINNKNFDILISAIECGVSNDIINYIINQVNYNSLDYCFCYENNEYQYSFYESIPLFVAISKNEFDIANLLLQNNANINYSYYYNNIFAFLNNNNVMNNANLKFILNKGIKIDNTLLEETINEWLSGNKNDLLNVLFKYYILNHYDELKNVKVIKYNEEISFIKHIIQRIVNVENFKVLNYFINESNEKENEILEILCNILGSKDKSLYRKDYITYNRYFDYYLINDRNEIYDSNKKTKVLNSIDNEEIKIKIEKVFTRRKDIIELLKRNNFIEFQHFIDENNIILKKLNNKNFDILISAIEYGVSNDIMNYIINQVNYDSLDYSFRYENNEYQYSFNKSVPPLFVAIAKNEFDIANVLLQNKANINYNNLFNFLMDNSVMNNDNLKFILENGIKINNTLLEETINKWLSSNRNDLLEVIFKYYIINHFEELNDINKNTFYRYSRETHSIIENIIKKIISIDNYKLLEIFIRESGEKENEILNILFEYFETCNNDINKEKNYNTRDNRNIKSNFKNKDKKKEILNSIDNEVVKTKVEKIFTRRKDIIELLKRNNFIELQHFVDENNIILKKLNNKNFDILISAIECGVSNDIMNYIINQVNYNSLNYSFSYENNEYKYSFHDSIPLFVAIAKNEFNIANILIQNKANINYNNLFKFLNDNNVMNSDNLKFILENGIKIDISSLKMKIYQWISDNNDLLKIFYKYYYLKYDKELEHEINSDGDTYSFIKNIFIEAIKVENYTILEFFINNSDQKEEKYLNIIMDMFTEKSYHHFLI